MRVIARKTLSDFWEAPGRADAEQPLRAWFAEASAADWKSINDVRKTYRTADFVGNDRIVFNIGGNKYRLIVALKYPILFVRFIGTHREYDRIDASKV